MNEEQEKQFIKNNAKQLREFFEKKLRALSLLVFDSPKEQRDRYVDSINILREWLREVTIVESGKPPIHDNFV